MKPLTTADADLFEGCVADALKEVPEDLGMIIAAHEEGGAIVTGVGAAEDAAAFTAAVDQLVAARPAALAAGLKLMWAPGDEETGGRPEPAWVVITVVPGRTARVLVKRFTEDVWWRLKPPECPWLVLSTASSLRAAVEQGKPMVLKQATDDRLFKAPGQGPVPPTDARGNI